MGKSQAQQAEVGAALRMQPITALRLRVQADPAVFAIGEHARGLSLKDLTRLAIVSARALE